MKKIKVKDKKFIDEDNNQRLFNGICMICRDKTKGYIEPKIEQKIESLSRKGFNLIRFGIFWDGVEPEPGVYDDAYLMSIKYVIDYASKCGMYVFLDMHQDLFSAKYIDGAPEWATLSDGLEHPDNLDIWYEAYLKSPAVIRAADNFWENKKAIDNIGLLDHYEDMWEIIAEKVENCENLIGFEPMNEPYMGSIAPQAFEKAYKKIGESGIKFDINNPMTISKKGSQIMKEVLESEFKKFDKDTLMPFYNRMLKAIRKHTQKALITGANIYGTFVETGIEKINDNEQNNIQQIYAPHGYDSVVDTDNYENYNKENVTEIFKQIKNKQDELNLPVIVGEWGNFPSGDFTNSLIQHMNKILEKNLWSSTYHQYEEGIENDKNYSKLERGYPLQIAGDLKSYSYDGNRNIFNMQWDSIKDKETVIYIPDLSCISAEKIVTSNKCSISIEKIDKSKGGYIFIKTIESKETIIRIK